MRRQKNFGSMKCSKPAVETYFFIGTTLRCRKNPLFWDMQPCGAEKIHYFGTCNPAAQKKSIILGLATLRRRKNPLFWDVQPCGAEKIHYFLTLDPPAPSQKRTPTAIKHAQRQGEG